MAAAFALGDRVTGFAGGRTYTGLVAEVLSRGRYRLVDTGVHRIGHGPVEPIVKRAFYAGQEPAYRVGDRVAGRCACNGATCGHRGAIFDGEVLEVIDPARRLYRIAATFRWATGEPVCMTVTTLPRPGGKVPHLPERHTVGQRSDCDGCTAETKATAA